MIEIQELPLKRGNVPFRVARGHFATNHSHINYYIDISAQKTRLTEAIAVAKELAPKYVTDLVDTILCLDGTAVIGTCLARELVNTPRGINEHRDISVLEPEYNANSQIIFRDNAQPLIRDKHVLILMASVTTGFTANRSIEAIRYYGGEAAGIAALYSTVPESAGILVHSVYDIRDLPNYASYDYRDCPYCKAGRRLDALVNSFGYSAL
jgi:orotate phosphoribosyltransferase